MSKRLSNAARAAAFAQQTGEVFLTLVEIEHDDLGAPIRLVDNTENVTSNGNVYTACGFSVPMADDSADSLARTRMTIDNVDQALTVAIRSVRRTPKPTVTLSVVLASSPDVIEFGPFTYFVNSIAYDARSVTLDLSYEDILNERFHRVFMTPVGFPGLFKQ